MTSEAVPHDGVNESGDRARSIPWWSIAKGIGIGLFVALLAIQFFPYGRDHSNPSVTNSINWDSPRTEQLFNDACADCHSNETDWPWYSNVAPVSWLVQRDVDEGREEFNISEPGGMDEADEAAETIREGEMPPWFYKPTHPESWLSDQEISDLVAGLEATFGSETGDDD